MSYGLLLLRVVLGLTLAAHGSQKIFGWFEGPGPSGTAGFFRQLGFRAPVAMAALAGLAELGGAAFALGIATPFAALGMAVVMLMAIATVHWKNGFWAANGGFEFNLAILTVAVAVSATGPGRFSLDRALGWDDSISGLWWGVGVLAAAIATAAATLVLFRRHGAAARAPEPA
jgi:putative oxidoreductase